MYQSKEIRWFFKEDIPAISLWFSKQGIDFTTIKSRTDHYLHLPGREDMSIKMREGNIEIKQRIGGPVPHALTNNANGFLEDWIKWSFGINETNGEAKEIIKNKSNYWVKISKERLGVKITVDANGNPIIHEMEEMLPAGCQLEYTRINTGNELWYSFAAEWFGKIKPSVGNMKISGILSGHILEVGNSCGYNEFINKLILPV